MWLRYQQVASKMASFDPRESRKNQKEEGMVKYRIKRFEPTLRTSLQIVIPTNLERLKKHKTNIKKYQNDKRWKDLNMEQINASRTVQQLKATIRELEKVKDQVHDDDLDEFERRISPMKEEALDAVGSFVALNDKRYDLITSNNSQAYHTPENMENEDGLFSNMTSASSNIPVDDVETFADPLIANVQIQDHQKYQEEIAACQSWDNLRDGLIELNTLVKDFAAVVHSQQEVVDRIEDNIENTQENVRSATTLLAQASKYKAAAIPVVGAIVGGLIGGPIGLMAGFKLAGAAAAVGGGVAGYTGGRYLKNKHDGRVDMELQNLSKSNEDKEK